MNKEKNQSGVVTRAEKKDATKQLIRELLQGASYKHNDLIEEVAKLYTKHLGEETDNVNDVKGRVGSVLDIMKKEQDVVYEGGRYALKDAPAEIKTEKSEQEKPKKTRAKKVEKKETVQETVTEEKKKTRKSKKGSGTEMPKTSEKETSTDENAYISATPVSLTDETPSPDVLAVANDLPQTLEKPAPKKRGRKAKTTTTTENVEKAENDVPMSALTEEKPQSNANEENAETTALTQTQKGEVAQKNVVMDMSFLFGGASVSKKKENEEVTDKKEKEEKPQQTEVALPVAVAQEEKQEKKTPTVSKKPMQKELAKETQKSRRVIQRAPARPMTAEEKLKDAYLKKIRSLGGGYFEYYSVYLLEKYSRKNGRRLEGLKIIGGDNDGGIDGEIELTDRLGFRETIYIQSKNWNPDKGNEKLWVVGETLLQQFIGACACRQARDKKQHCRGIFITTSRFTPEAKRILENMSDKIVGYDGDELFETAKECEFGLVKKNGEWALDDKLLSGDKAFFTMS